MQRRYRINQYIRSSPVRVIDEEGKNLGTLSISEALHRAHESGLDLIEIAPTVTPPVCKIMDFGKFKYQREKGEHGHTKKQKEVEVKGVRIGFTTGQHDLLLRADQIKKFLDRGDKVRIDMRLRGREKAHMDVARAKFDAFLKILPIEYTLEMAPKRFPQGFIAIIIKK